VSISSEVKSLTEDIEASYDARIAAVSDIVNGTHQALGNFHREHEKMARDLKRSLAASEKDRRKEFATLIGEIKDVVAAIEKDTVETLADFKSDDKNRSKTVGNMLAGFSADQRQARTHWKKLSKVMAAKRSSKVTPSPKAKTGVPTPL
jgi:septal ring factor EnvC (AmiA/AmiB activator)